MKRNWPLALLSLLVAVSASAALRGAPYMPELDQRLSELEAGTSLGTGAVTSTAILNGTILNADVNASAAIAYSKLDLALGIVNGDVSASAAIVGSKLASTINAFCITGATCTETSSTNAGALSVSVFRSNVSSAGAESRTLAAPASDGVVKVIIMTVHVGDVTLAGTNIWGQTSATCTLDAVGDSLILLSAGGKWVILANTGITCA